MRQVVVHRAGGFSRLALEERPEPTPRAGEVRVRARAIGVNYADCVVRMGLYASAKEYVGWPITPGFELAGEIDALGADVDLPAVGERAVAVTRFGGYAESVCVPREQVFPLPEGFGFEEAAAFPTAHLTAWYALFRLARPEPEAKVLVHSAAGGVGGALVQLARIAGCRVAGVVGAPHKVEAARELGCELVLDRSAGGTWRAAERFAPEGYDVVFDAHGPATLRAGFEHLAPEGRLVVYGFHDLLPRRRGVPNPLRLALGWLRTPRFSPFDLTQRNRAVLGFNLSFLFHRTDLLQRAMDELLGWVRAGRLASPRVTPFALTDVAGAHRALQSGATVGKLVLVP